MLVNPILLTGIMYKWNQRETSKPLCILDKRQIHLRKQTIVQVKVQWKHYSAKEATWEIEETMRQKFPTLFLDYNNNID